MPLFTCRWQNGDFSAVSAASRDEAMELLDEVGNADVADLFTVKNFMVHFQLKTEADNMEEPVPVELEGFGDGTYEMLCERVYPVYGKVSGKERQLLHSVFIRFFSFRRSKGALAASFKTEQFL
jgi:hypothetical protein